MTNLNAIFAIVKQQTQKVSLVICYWRLICTSVLMGDYNMCIFSLIWTEVF